MSVSGGAHEVDAPQLYLILLLSTTAGWVDCVCYIALFHVFVANMTGNTIATGIGLGQERWALLLRRGLAIPLFVLGLVTSRIWMRWAAERGFRRAGTIAYLAEAAMLALFVALGDSHVGASGRVVTRGALLFYVLVAIPSFAMGVQNATLSHFGPVSIRTTHVSGTLAHFADEIVSLCFGLPKKGGQEPNRKRSFRRAGVYLGAWIAYVAGATLGACGEARWHLRTLVVPIAVLAVVGSLTRAPRPERVVDDGACPGAPPSDPI